MKRDRLLTAAKWLLRGLGVLNWIAMIGFAAAIVLSFGFEPRIHAHLLGKYGAAFDAVSTLHAMRLLALLGIAVAAAIQVIFVSLLRMLVTVEAGDPFIMVNAARLQTIGWALLAIQLLDLGFGAAVAWIVSLGAEVGSGWQPSVLGWLAVLLVFVLARVFKIGSRMRDEIEMTV